MAEVFRDQAGSEHIRKLALQFALDLARHHSSWTSTEVVEAAGDFVKFLKGEQK